MPLHINEPRLVKVQDVTRALSFAVLLDTPQYISGDPDIRTTAIPVRHDIDPATFFHAGLWHEHQHKEKPNPVSSTGRRGWEWLISKNLSPFMENGTHARNGHSVKNGKRNLWGQRSRSKSRLKRNYTTDLFDC
jgi:hypothetical protein